MFSSLGLFQGLQCPQSSNCSRQTCLFNHSSDLKPPPSLQIPVDEPKQPSSSQSSSAATTVAAPAPSAPVRSLAKSGPAPHTKRTLPAASSQSQFKGAGFSSLNGPGEPPRKLQKLGPTQRPVALPTASHTTSGVPLLKVNAAQSQVAVPVRQTMLKTLFDHYTVLYEVILPSHPSLASEHALRQEEEVYKTSTKLTYRNAIITTTAAIKRRPVPDNIGHPSVGTEGDLVHREAARKSIKALSVTRKHLDSHVLSVEDMTKWGYVTSVPEGEGGSEPSIEGKVSKCERCAQPFQVKRKEEAEQCVYHWGRPYTTMNEGKRLRVYNCCSRPAGDSEGCVRGPHVFYEQEIPNLHLRHGFSHTRPPHDSDTPDAALDVVVLDCEMVYTTGGFRCARVSVVDGSGSTVFDELVRMDEGVEVIDYNTRFSGITADEYSKAVLPLASIRQSLDAFINSETVIVGHALENDLKTLRMIHHRCVDTAIMFPHPAGPPYRRALRDLAREHLGIRIQTGGGTTGHSSVEDSVATLDLVRWHMLNKSAPKPKPSPAPVAVAAGPSSATISTPPRRPAKRSAVTSPTTPTAPHTGT
ncbi:hypothetical protein HGRIS_009518 [Hohenbuehelia grisea]|uniref:Exonuclease domain-containing protein n=1 Tax=Hohenbuehelia grisea TaxID=104357 RepID=A0ABR3J1K8_9AGAR